MCVMTNPQILKLDRTSLATSLLLLFFNENQNKTLLQNKWSEMLH